MDKALRSRPFSASHVLVTGANGYVGAMIVACLLRDSAANITCLTRAGHARDAVLAPIIDEWEHQSRGRWSAAVERRIRLLTLPEDLADLADLAPCLAGVDEIIHCAGCLDYNDTARLRSANLWYTAHLLALARRLSVARLVYVSTAFSGGYRSGGIAEERLGEPVSDPTPYTLTKRQAEHLVAASGIPFVVIRPSILIGSSATGRYSGKRYGLYQQWMSLKELTCDRYHAEFHTVASDARLNVLHQDAFCEAFKAAHRWLPDGSYMNLVSDPRTVPTLRELWDMWFEVTRPAVIYYYPTIADIPLRQIHLRQRTYLTFAKVNLEIASHHWQFETRWLDLLRAKGLRFADATAASVHTCQDRFVAFSEVIGKYLADHSAVMAPHSTAIDVDTCDATMAVG